jgi:hypothetical protein
MGLIKVVLLERLGDFEFEAGWLQMITWLVAGLEAGRS